MARLFDYDPVTKKKQLFHWNAAEESVVLETLQDVTDTVEDAKGRFNLVDERAGWKGDTHHVARIPDTVYFALPKALRDDPAALRRWLNDPAQRAFRTRPGTL
jgi:hypothetical protein